MFYFYGVIPKKSQSLKHFTSNKVVVAVDFGLSAFSHPHSVHMGSLHVL